MNRPRSDLSAGTILLALVLAAGLWCLICGAIR